MEDHLAQAVTQLKNAKSQGLNYYDATQSLLKQGFSQEEINQAADQFPYNEDAPIKQNEDLSDKAGDQAVAEEEVHQEAIDAARQEVHDDVTKSFFGGRSFIGQYYGSKAISDYAALKDLEHGKSLNDPESQANPAQTGGSVFRRNRAVRIYAFLSLLPLLFLAPYFWRMLFQIPKLVDILLHQHSTTAVANYGLYIWSICGCLAYICIALMLFFARRESTIIRAIYIIVVIESAYFVLFAIYFKSTVFLAFGAFTVLPALWISRRVGLLSQL